MPNKQRKSVVQAFLSSNRQYPILAGIAAGLYPIFFYYSNNFTLINTWLHLLYFLLWFLVVPAGVIFLASKLFKIEKLSKWRKYIVPFLNIFIFLFLLKICLYAGIQRKMIVGIFIIAVLLSYFLKNHFKKIIVIQLILAFIGLMTLIPVLFKQLNYSEVWKVQPDTIEQAVFNKKPNVYFIQPDGYINFAELKKGYYNFDNSQFESFLKQENFKSYPNFRSNYASTLASNSATFVMKHHYYNGGKDLSEALNAREAIISENPVLTVFKNNGYQTFFITEKPYLLQNRPKMGFDYSNFSYDEIPFISTGLSVEKETLPFLKEQMAGHPETPKFFFIELFEPGHIQNIERNSEGNEKERQKWLEILKIANKKLKAMVSEIKIKDPQALIIIMADHGGYVGLDYAEQYLEKTQDRDLIYSMFGANLSINWPNDEVPVFDSELKSAVNVFRVIFTYLSNDKKYLQKLQPNKSYIILDKDVPEAGVYEYIDENGNITAKPL